MTVRVTSMLAWIGVNRNGTASKLRGRVFLFLDKNPRDIGYTRAELAHALHVRINTITSPVLLDHNR